jgi:hypothetical protein
MLRIALLVSAGLALVAWVVWVTERRSIAIAAACIAAGAAIAFSGAWLVDCRACHTAPLAVGVLASVPFFGAGWIALIASGRDPWTRRWFLPLLAAAALQALWAAPLILSSTIRGQCPCAGLFFDRAESTLSAIGIDRWVGPILLAEAALTLWLAWSAFTARAEPPR